MRRRDSSSTIEAVLGRLAITAVLAAWSAGCGAASDSRADAAEARRPGSVAELVQCTSEWCDVVVDCSALVREEAPFNRCIVYVDDLEGFGCETAPDAIRCADAGGANQHLLRECCPLR
ncbi:MAG: hypothetical protein R6V85_15890 [Polyangia bacterium]